jgi:hypothetical protein
MTDISQHNGSFIQSLLNDRNLRRRLRHNNAQIAGQAANELRTICDDAGLPFPEILSLLARIPNKPEPPTGQKLQT